MPTSDQAATATTRRMKIWLITNLYSPDVHGGAVLYADLAVTLKKQGHDVRVTTTFPYYPDWKLRPEDKGVKLRVEEHLGVPTRRVSIYVPEKLSGLRRVLFDASFLWPVLTRGRFPNWTPDLIITAEPMLSECIALRFLFPFNKKVRKLIIVQDFAADAAIELGLLKNPIAAALARGVERWALRAADVVTTISPGMLDKLHQVLRLPSKADQNLQAFPRTAYVPNWIHSSLAEAAAARLQSPPSREQRTLVYAGNVGKKQGLPDFVRHFSALSHNWCLKIYGAGADADSLRELIAQLCDSRIELHGILDDDAYLNRLLTATACVVTQKPGIGANFLPSKVLPCLATGTPILAVCDPTSPLGQEVMLRRIGVLCDLSRPGDLQTALSSDWNAPELRIDTESFGAEFGLDGAISRFFELLHFTD